VHVVKMVELGKVVMELAKVAVSAVVEDLSLGVHEFILPIHISN